MKTTATRRTMVLTGHPTRRGYYVQNVHQEGGRFTDGVLSGAPTAATGTVTVDLQVVAQVVTITVGGDIQATDIARVNDGTDNFDHTVVPGDDANTVASGLAAALDASPLYSAAAALNVVTVTAAVPGTPFTLTDQTVNTQAGGADLVCTVLTTVANVASNFDTDTAILTLDGYELKSSVHYAVDVNSVANTATNLAAAISELHGYSASALGAVVTISGPVGPDGRVPFTVLHYGSKKNLTLSPTSGTLTPGNPALKGPVFLGP